MKIIALQNDDHRRIDDDDNLVRASRNGERPAFDRLVDRYDPDLRRFLSRRIGATEIEDVCQETWLGAWASISRFDGRCRFKTWLFGISMMKLKDHYRASVREQMRLPHDSIDDAIAYTDGRFDQAELRESVLQILESLTPSQREMLSLYYESELSLPEIAILLNRNLNTVKYQFYRAHAQAAEHIDKTSDPTMRPPVWIRRKP